MRDGREASQGTPQYPKEGGKFAKRIAVSDQAFMGDAREGSQGTPKYLKEFRDPYVFLHWGRDPDVSKQNPILVLEFTRARFPRHE